MKKLLIAMVIGLLLVAALATTALADNGPHGNFSSSNTDACAGCHRAHQAQGADFLLKSGDVYDLCTSCHDGSGAYTNVVDGTYNTVVSGGTALAGTGTQGDAGVGLFGGGFTNAKMSHAWTYKSYYDTSVTPLAQPVTSKHNVSGTSGTLWGSGAFVTSNASTTGATAVTLECTSCHDPHGNAGRDASSNPVPTYRLLRFVANGSAGYEAGMTWTSAVTKGISYAGTATGITGLGATVSDVATKWYTINSDVTLDQTLAAFKAGYGSTIFQSSSWGNGAYFVDNRGVEYQRPGIPTASLSSYSCDWVSKTTPFDYRPVGGNVNGMIKNCATVSPSVTGTTFNNRNASLGVSMFCSECHDRYYADSAARSTNTNDPNFSFRHASATTSIGCVDCHNAHGTSSVASGMVSAGAPNMVSYAGGITLLKMDNREICMSCHQTAVNEILTNN